MKTEIGVKASRAVHKVGFYTKKYSPEILIVSGVAGMIVSTVLACKATVKAKETLDDGEKKLEEINESTEEDSKIVEKQQKSVRLHTGFEIIKLYSPSVAIGVASVTCIFSSNAILRKRNVALAAAYTAIDQGFKEYRKRVADRFGKDVENEIRYDIHQEEITEEVTDEKGKTKEVKKKVDVARVNGYSEYSRFFDSSCKEYTKNAEYNLQFLLAQEKYANDRLKSRGYLFLNDVYEALGIPISVAGQSVGWIYDEKNPTGDNFVNFGIFNVYREKNRDFVNGYEPVILLDFNVDGPILEDVQKRHLVESI